MTLRSRLPLPRQVWQGMAMITLLAGLPAAATAQSTCETALTALQVASGGTDSAAILAAWQAVAPAGCDDAQLRGARSQTSALIARAAQGLLTNGDVDGAEELVLQAPGVHWAVQAVRGDIAAKRGNRAEAAKMYNAALDTLGDPVQTVQNEQLVPVAERLSALAQENMMLAGSMESTVTRGGGASGVMAMAARGLAVEKVATAPAAGQTTDTYATQQPANDAYVAQPPQPAADTYTAQSEDSAVTTYVQPAAPEPTADPYANAPAQPAYQPAPQEYNVISAAAEKVDSVFLPIRFGFDSDQLDASGVREALRLGEFLKANAVGQLVITGHTDDVGDGNYNLDLSLRRAESLAGFLLSDGVQTRITVVGKGESEPPLYTDAAVYSIDELRTIARRVEVAFGY